MSTATLFIKEGINAIKMAKQKENEQDYKSALSLYMKGIQNLSNALNHTTNEKTKRNIQSKINEFSKRIEACKQSSNILNVNYTSKGTELIKQAIKMDNNKQFEIALNLYKEGIEYLMKSLNYERNETVISTRKQNIQKYLQRAEDIKRSLEYSIANDSDQDEEDKLEQVLKEAGIHMKVQQNKNINVDNVARKLIDTNVQSNSQIMNDINEISEINSDESYKEIIVQKDEEIKKLKQMNAEIMKQKDEKLKKMQQKLEMEEQKKDNQKMDIKEELFNINCKMKTFMNTFDNNKLAELHKLCYKSLLVKQEIENTWLCANVFVNRLSEMESFISKLNPAPDPLKYKEWDIDAMIIWIESLEDGRFKPYIKQLKHFFIEDKIVKGFILPNITRKDLREEPCNIKDFTIGKALEIHFKKLKQTFEEYDQEIEGDPPGHITYQ